MKKNWKSIIVKFEALFFYKEFGEVINQENVQNKFVKQSHQLSSKSIFEEK